VEKISIELWVSIGINLLMLAYFAGNFSATQKNLKEQLTEMKDDFADTIKELKDNFHEKLETLEKKQDKHNNLVEKVYCAERDISVLKEQVSVGNHRIKDIEDVQHECNRHRRD